MVLNLGIGISDTLREWRIEVECRQCKKETKDWRFTAKRWDERMYYDVVYYCKECFEQFKEEFM